MILKQQVEQAFARHFGAAPEQIVHAPGRVNLIGEHTDYNNGFVFPAAINFGTTIAASKRSDDLVKVLALDFEGATDEFSLSTITQHPEQSWANYVRGVVLMLQGAFPQVAGIDFAVSGNVPQGAGLSSSASFEIAILKAFSQLYELPLDGVKAALLGQKAENEFVGCACGIMDQLISAMGEKDRAMLLDCNDLTFKHTSLPDAFSIMIINSNVKRGLVDSEYNVRREQCEEAAAAMNCSSLRDASLDMLAANKSAMSDKAYKRALHVLTENDRTLTMFDALNAGDIQTVSAAMAASHASMRDDFEITVPPIDALVSMVDEVIGNKGGVRMTGGGFGGCVVALVPDELVDAVKSCIASNYEKQTNYHADIYICSAENGAFV